MIEMGPEGRSKPPLHNFAMPWLKWGSRKVMRCMKVDNSNGEVPASAFDHRRSSERILIGRSRDSELERRGSTDHRRRENFKFSSSPAPAEVVGGSGRKSKHSDDGIEAVREKLMFDLQTAADRMKDAILREGLEEQEPPAATNASSANDALRPWNLRTRRAACKEPPTNGISYGGGGGMSFQADVLKPISSPLKTEATKSLRLLRGSAVATTAGAASASGEKRDRAKFSVSLSRREIEDDFMTMATHRLPRRPKKRSKNVQKQLDMLFPGLWLTEINAEFYKVLDAPETGNR